MTDSNWIRIPIIAFTISATSLFGTSTPVEVSLVPIANWCVTGAEERKIGDELQPGTSKYLLMSVWHEYVFQRFDELMRGAYDFTGLRIPTFAAIEHAKSIVNDTLQPNTATPSVVPSEDGAILMVWRKAGWDVEFEVDENSATVWAHRRSDSSGWYGPLSDYSENFSSLLEELSRA